MAPATSFISTGFQILAVLLAVSFPASTSIARNIEINTLAPGYSATSLELGQPFAGSLTSHATSYQKVYASTGTYGNQQVLLLNTTTGSTTTIADGFGSIGAIISLPNNDLIIAENYSSNTLYRARDLDMDGTCLDPGEVTTLFESMENTSPTVSTEPEIIYEVSLDGTKEFTNIESAIAAATDPTVRKVIRIHPGHYTYPLTVNTRLRLMVPNTHIVGSGPQDTRITARSDKGDNAWGVMEVRAPNCTVTGIWLHNSQHRFPTPSSGNKASALTIGTALDNNHDLDAATTVSGVRIRNCWMSGSSLDRASSNLAWDIVTIGSNVVDCVFSDKCEMFGYSDTLSSWSDDVLIKDCTIIAHGPAPLWIAGGQNYSPYSASENPTLVLKNCRLGARLHYVAGGGSGPTSTNPAVPKVYLDHCTNANTDGLIPEAARCSGAPLQIEVYCINTPHQPAFSIPGGTGTMPVIIRGDIRSEMEPAPSGNQLDLPTGSLLFQQTTTGTVANLVVIDDPMGTATLRFGGHSLFTTAALNGGVGFTQHGAVLAGTSSYGAAELLYMIDTDADEHFSADESHVIATSAQLPASISDLTVTAENTVLVAGNSGAIHKLIPTGQPNGLASSAVFAETNALYLTAVAINSPNLSFAPTGGTSGATLWLGGITDYAEPATNIIAITPTLPAAVNDWELFQ